ncbi:flagellin [Butyrivibrio proteoclasticus]|uniref:flagellin n=1 Tax=Butyrivibrio proteoclasticus TaxID=43305 RepID=UPI00047CB5B6|nr:flagellin [Butyrivibrio proteoclasticus]
MSGVSSVSGYSGYDAYSTISAGGTYTKAAQGASELAIQEKTKAQVNGLEAGEENLTSAKSALNVEEGAMAGIEDYLQSIKELSLKAMNGTLSDEDKQSVQDQIKEYMEGINDIAKNTTYNEKQLLNNEDVPTSKFEFATDSSGSTKEISTYNSTTEALGIDDYDVTKDFDISKIDKALDKVTSMRSNTGAETNGVEHALTYNSHAALELNGYQMDKEEDNSVKAYQELKTKQALDAYQNVLEKQKMDDREQQNILLFS